MRHEVRGARIKMKGRSGEVMGTLWTREQQGIGDMGPRWVHQFREWHPVIRKCRV